MESNKGIRAAGCRIIVPCPKKRELSSTVTGLAQATSIRTMPEDMVAEQAKRDISYLNQFLNQAS